MPSYIIRRVGNEARKMPAKRSLPGRDKFEIRLRPPAGGSGQR
jgi:hypothetical protein